MRLTMRKGKAICCSAFEKGECHFEYCEQCDHEAEAWSKLTEYEDLEEQGLLLRLPCKVGDTVYILKKIVECKFDYDCKLPCLQRFKCEEGYGCEYEYGVYVIREKRFNVAMLDIIDKTVFLTKEEAEQALAEMKKDVVE